jgi:predicted nucleic acid-binding protein
MIGLVIDTNVLVSANLNADGLEAVVVALAFNRKDPDARLRPHSCRI